jgi:hypothetical protein
MSERVIHLKRACTHLLKSTIQLQKLEVRLKREISEVRNLLSITNEMIIDIHTYIIKLLFLLL